MSNGIDWMRRDKNQRFSLKLGEPKTLRKMRLTDTCWDSLKEIADEDELTRTDLVELFARRGGAKGIILKAIDEFLDHLKNDYGESPSQKGKKFEPEMLREYKKLLEFRHRIATGEFVDVSDQLAELMLASSDSTDSSRSS